MIEKRFNELYNRSYDKNIICFTDFLNIDEQSILEGTYLPCVKYGGYPLSERVVAGFGKDIDETDFPIALLKISPVNQKFADKLTHRDFLGALMNLGIKRELLGDIIVSENTGYLFCLEQIKDYIIDNLSRLKHTTVSVCELNHLPDTAVREPESRQVIVSSLRLDALISAVYKLSRSESNKLFSQDRVFVNSKAAANNSYQLKDGDIISVRGFGRIYYISQLKTTKKNRIVVDIRI